MDEFENQFNNQANENNTNPPRPDYYRPSGENPSQTQNNENTTYHYSYVKPDEQKTSQTAQNNSGYYYTPPQNNPNQNYSQNTNNTNYYTPPQSDQSTGSYSPYGNYYNGDNNNDNSNKPPKKSKAGIIIIIVLVICLIVAGIGLGLGAKGMLESADKPNESTSQADSSSDKKLSDSEEVPLKDKDNNYTVAGVAENCRDSCVGITVYTQQTSYDYFFGYGQGSNSNGGSAKSGEGSGVLFSESNGKTYIITCAHVISDADEFTVTLDNGKEYKAQMVGVDAQTDIGVLSIDETGLKIAEFADSSKVVVGEQVVAIGCPGGLEFLNSLSSGYVSALDRPISSSIGYNNECIQTDTAINPGNSGGALFNMQGQVVGINSSKIASTEYEGMGFAVPSKTAVDTANSLIRVGYVAGRAKIGITYSPITSFNNSETIINALASKGYKDAQGTMVIDTVDSSSDLANKDVKSYDMIVAVNGKTLTSTDVMTSVLSASKPGDTIKLTIARIEGQDITVKDVDCKLIESKD